MRGRLASVGSQRQHHVGRRHHASSSLRQPRTLSVVRHDGTVEREGRGAQTREKVLAAALAVVQERPLAEVQLQHIAARAGISAGHILYHFGSKDRILVETLRWSEESMARDRVRHLSELSDPAAALGGWIVLFLPRGQEDPTWKLWLEFWLRSTMDEELRQIPRGVSERWISDLERILDDGLERGTFSDVDKDAFMTWAHSLLVGLSIGVLAGWLTLEHAQRVAVVSIAKEIGCSIPLAADGANEEQVAEAPPT
jgi:AcrR family transcriptional regulator